MKFQNLSVKRLFSRVAMGLVLSMSGITIALFLVTKQTAVLLTNGVRVLGLYQLAQLKTVAVRQVDVQQHQIKFPLTDSFGCGSGI